MKWKVSAKTTYLVSKNSTTIEHIEARSRGIPIIDPTNLQKILHGKEVCLEDLPSPHPVTSDQSSLHRLMGEARSAVQDEPTHEKWLAIVKLLDACREEEVQLLSDYIDAHTSRWTQLSMKESTGYSVQLANLKAPKNPKKKRRRDDNYQGLRGELRIAPQEWLDQLQLGEKSPKFKIVRALDFPSHKERTGTAIVKILKNASLTHVETIHLSCVLLSKGIIEAMCKLPTLTRLKISVIDTRTADAFHAVSKTAVCKLHTLDVSSFGYPKKFTKEEEIYAFLLANVFEHVQTLHIKNDKEGLELLTFLDAEKALPNLEHVHLEKSTAAPFLKRLFAHKLFQARIKKLSMAHLFYWPSQREEWVDLFATKPTSRLELFDLSGLTDGSCEKGSDAEVLDMLRDLLPSSTLLEQVDELVLGEWKTQEILDALARHQPHLSVS